jgi:hypothetical protein
MPPLNERNFQKPPAHRTRVPWVHTTARANFEVEPKKSFVCSKIHFCTEPNEPREPKRNPHIELRVCVNSRKRIL